MTKNMTPVLKPALVDFHIKNVVFLFGPMITTMSM